MGFRKRYSYSGVITLHSSNGKAVACNRYGDIHRRKEIVAQWVRSYPNKSGLFIQICPDIDDTLDELHLNANIKKQKAPRRRYTKKIKYGVVE